VLRQQVNDLMILKLVKTYVFHACCTVVRFGLQKS